jgi:hypothetical protein
VLVGEFVPVSVSTAKVWLAGTVSCADQEIVQPVPVPVAATQLVVEPELAVAPSMNTAACPVEGDTNAGLRALLCARPELEPIVKVPLACWSEAVPFEAPRPLPEPPPEQAESSTAVQMHATD